jgi:glycosyltransferase involved in cell wall biosynthesis
VDRQGLHDALRAADVFVCTSRIECFPRVNLEAMHLGLPLITTPVFGVPEQVFDGVNGLYYKVGDATQLAGHIQKLVSDVPLRLEMAANSSQIAKVLPSDIDVADSYARMLYVAFLARL